MADHKEEVSYELQVKSGPNWQTHSVYKADKVNTAMADAKSLEKLSTIQAVKLVKEFYDEGSGQIRQRTMYQYPEAPVPKPTSKLETKPKRYQPPIPSRRTLKPNQPSKPAQPTLEPGQKFQGALVFIQTMMALGVALVAGIVVSNLATIVLGDMERVLFISRDDFVIGLFIVVFVITAVGLVGRILVRSRIFKPQPPAASSAPVSARAAGQDPELRQAPPMPSEEGMAAAPVPSAVQEQADKAEAEKTEEEKAQTSARPDGQIGFNAFEQPEPAAAISPQLAECVRRLDDFTRSALGKIETPTSEQDAYAVLGTGLFFVGAAHAMAQEKNFSVRERDAMLTQCLSTVGIDDDRARHFVDNADAYLVVDPRYSQMFQAGRSALAAWTAASDQGPERGDVLRDSFAQILADWNKPKPTTQALAPVAVLFTDIAGSTALTQELGDEGAQEVVRDHNAIVRDALATFVGREVKHTGDGIMAAFPTAGQGVEAAIEIQRRVQLLKTTKPTTPLVIKIGLNAGEPISEDDDLFGTTVQLAARLVDKAQPGEILVSEIVHGLAQGKSLKFARAGQFEMKGFAEGVSAYRVLWDGDTGIVEAAPQADSGDGEAQATPDKAAPPEAAAPPDPTPSAND